jgi:hypothetical protein
MVLKIEVEGATSLAFVRVEADEFTRKVVLMEGELADACQAWEMAEANFQGLSDRLADVD